MGEIRGWSCRGKECLTPPTSGGVGHVGEREEEAHLHLYQLRPVFYCAFLLKSFFNVFCFFKFLKKNLFTF